MSDCLKLELENVNRRIESAKYWRKEFLRVGDMAKAGYQQKLLESANEDWFRITDILAEDEASRN